MRMYAIVLGLCYSAAIAGAVESPVVSDIQQAIGAGNYRQALVYADAIQWQKAPVETQLVIVHAYELMGHYQQASQRLQIMEQNGVVRRDPTLQARVEYRMASINRRLGHYKEALKYAERARGEKTLAADRVYQVRLAGMLAILHAYLGHNAKAKEWFANAYRRLQTGSRLPLQALLLMNDKTIWLYRMGRFQDALALESEAIRLAEAVLPKKHPELAEAYNNIAASHMAVGHVQDAALWYQKAIRLRKEKLGMQHPDLATSMNNFALVLLQRGDDQQAESLLRAALKIRLASLGNSHPFSLSSMNNLSQLLRKRGALNEAKHLAETSLKYAIIQFGQNHIEVAHAYTALGDLMLVVQDYAAAANDYRKALHIHEQQNHLVEAAFLHQKLGYVHQLDGELDMAAQAYEYTIKELEPLLGEQHPKLATIWSALGSVRYAQGKHGEAALAMQRALSIQRPLLGDLHPQTAASHNNIARIYTDMGKQALAIEHLELAANAFRYFARSDRQAVVYANLASLYAEHHRDEQAVEYFEKALDAVESLFSGSEGLSEEERSGIMGKYSWIYHSMMTLLLRMHRNSPDAGYDQKLLQTVSRNQSRVFSELMLKTNAWKSLHDLGLQKALARESDAKAHWMDLRYALARSAKRDTAARHQLVQQVKVAERGYRLAVRMLNTSFPRVTALRSPTAIDVSQIQKDLRQGEVVLVYALLERETLLFVIGQESFQLFPLSVGRKKVMMMVQQIRRRVSGEHGLQSLRQLKPEVLHQAYLALLAPAASILKHSKLLYVVGDGALYTLPFEMLVRNYTPAMKQKFRQQRRQSKAGHGVLFQEYANLDYIPWPIMYMPSLSALHVIKARKQHRYGKNLTAFANPVFFEGVSKQEQETYVQQRPLLRSLLRTSSTDMVALKPLPNTEHEARAIARILGGKQALFFGVRARESLLYTTDLSDSRYILFATHGLLGNDFSLPGAEPSLALSMDNALQEGEDGLLSMSEVLNLKINSELVALSACNTSGDSERAQNGEGFAGLTRAFMYAGARRLLVSHWSVETYSTQRLMQDFFADVANDELLPVALQQARNKLREVVVSIDGRKVSAAHPFFWAPFVLVGVQ